MAQNKRGFEINAAIIIASVIIIITDAVSPKRNSAPEDPQGRGELFRKNQNAERHTTQPQERSPKVKKL